MRTKQLADLVEIAKCSSMSVAAKNTHISRQALTNSIQSLEQELGCQIIESSKRGVRLTEQGEKVLIAAQEILCRLEILKADLADVEDVNTRIRGKITLCLSPMLNISILPYAFTEFRSHYPNVSIFTSEKYREEIIGQVAHDKDTCGILLVSKLIDEFFAEIPENVELIELKTYPIYIAMSPRHPLASQKSISINTLTQYPIVVFEVGGAVGVHALSKLSDDIDVCLSTSNPRICENVLNRDHAVMYSFPPYTKYNIFDDFRHIPVSDKRATLTTYIAINREMSKDMRQLVSLFVNTFAQYL